MYETFDLHSVFSWTTRENKKIGALDPCYFGFLFNWVEV